MHLAGIQEEKDKGFWITIICMDRKQVAKKYVFKKSYFFPDPSGEKLVSLMQQIREDRAFWEKKKQFSQIRRPPKWVDVPPRLMFRKDKGEFSENLLTLFKSLRFDLGAVLVKEVPNLEKLPAFLQEASEDDLGLLLEAVFGENRLDFCGETIPEKESYAFCSLCVALWGGEKVWRMVRYGG